MDEIFAYLAKCPNCNLYHAFVLIGDRLKESMATWNIKERKWNSKIMITRDDRPDQPS